jgi:hypothetical protein
MTLLNELKQIYVDTIEDQLTGNPIYVLDNCPTTDMKDYLQADNKTFKYSDIDTIIKNYDYREENTNEDMTPKQMNPYRLPRCDGKFDNDNSGCCIKVEKPIIDTCYNPVSNCPPGTSTGFMYKFS